MRGLPPGSALHRALDPKGWAWSYNEELLATLIEAVDAGNRQFISTFHGKNKAPKPIDVRRPWRDARVDTDEPRKQASPDEVARFFGAQLRRVK